MRRWGRVPAPARIGARGSTRASRQSQCLQETAATGRDGTLCARVFSAARSQADACSSWNGLRCRVPWRADRAFASSRRRMSYCGSIIEIENVREEKKVNVCPVGQQNMSRRGTAYVQQNMSRRGTAYVPLGNRQCLNGVRHPRSPFDRTFTKADLTRPADGRLAISFC